MWGYMGHYGGGWGGMGLGMIGMALFWILLIVGIVALVKGGWGPGAAGGRRQEKTALDVLKERYARGEIEKTEFEQKKRDLAV
ncbi:MAG TPA: SHOCT domain-containing protein [Rhodocyclaceae bacterium]|nr:SHOCT domain-containing protein [Rhodocyclaceae bacterium]